MRSNRIRSMKILFCMILCGFPLLASGQCLLEKLYALTGTLRQEMWAQKGVAGGLPDTLPAWPDFMLDSLDWGTRDWKHDISHYGYGEAKTYCPAYQVYAFIGDGAGKEEARLDVQELLCRWNEHRTILRHYERGYFAGLDKRQLLDSLQSLRRESENVGRQVQSSYERSLFVAWLEPDFVMDLSFLYYGDTLKYWNPEEWMWDRSGFRPNTRKLLYPERFKNHKKLGWRRNDTRLYYTQPTILELRAGTLYVKDSVMYSGFELDGDSLRLVPWQEELDKVYPSFAKHFNGLENRRSIRPSQRTRIANGRFVIGYRENSQKLWEDWVYVGRFAWRDFPASDNPESRDRFPLE